MEILSTGEKIRRARIYKGYTLKYICEDKISVSKMSCIENDKVVPEEWILDFLAEKLDLDIDYLKDDVKSQIKKNLEKLKKGNRTDYQQQLVYNLSYAEEYGYYKEAFEIMHLMFVYNIQMEKYEKLHVLMSKYYDICLKSKSDENQLTYYMDIAKYFYFSEEYMQAAGYYNTVKEEAKKRNDNEFIARATFNECHCYIMAKQYDIAYKVAKELMGLIIFFNDDLKKAESFHMMALLTLINNKDDFQHYEKKAYDLYGENKVNIANAEFNYAEAMFTLNLKDKAVEYIRKGLNYCPNEEEETLVKYMLKCIEKLIDNNIIEEAEKISDEAINYAIHLRDMRYIEKAYHLKALILGKKGELSSKEMYMNLSLDALMKSGTKKQIYERYMEMGHMYYNMTNVNESIKYFSLALNISKTI
ncbi:helix-turn-helix transcriptional regulator [uncultured Clostridium sp.]|uniref:helix-turn-helix domain-containing protein n=1 Tax=uncultured Clostridium sp. TaxID=59620 RepID=UPI0028EA8F14|nr:helix-turn-helix transcriptional regulator [uncultured Clostridium sp.]